jgi:hypothetical protein
MLSSGSRTRYGTFWKPGSRNGKFRHFGKWPKRKIPTAQNRWASGSLTWEVPWAVLWPGGGKAAVWLELAVMPTRWATVASTDSCCCRANRSLGGIRSEPVSRSNIARSSTPYLHSTAQQYLSFGTVNMAIVSFQQPFTNFAFSLSCETHLQRLSHLRGEAILLKSSSKVWLQLLLEAAGRGWHMFWLIYK